VQDAQAGEVGCPPVSLETHDGGRAPGTLHHVIVRWIENRSIVELVRSIHLNALRTKLVRDLKGLDEHPWCGHSSVRGSKRHEWQDRASVLSWFGRQKWEATKAYRR
jgi:hypothetical protein